jgi:hypothetical protein
MRRGAAPQGVKQMVEGRLFIFIELCASQRCKPEGRGRHDSLVRLRKIYILASWHHALERNPHQSRLHSGPDRSAGHVPGQSTESEASDAVSN